MKNRYFYSTLKIVLLAGTLSACAHKPPVNSGFDNFASYAESVFRHQNQLSSKLMMLSEADMLPDDEKFENAEESMSEACSLLNEYVEKERGGESMGLRFQQKVQDSVEICDLSIRRMEAMLNTLSSKAVPHP